MTEKVENLKDENLKLKKELSKYEAEILINNQSVEKGESWNGFGGKVILGVKGISINGFAEINLSIDGETIEKSVYPGEQEIFKVKGSEYILNIQKVIYVGSCIVIGVSKKL